MELQNLYHLFINDLRDGWSAESQLRDAFTEMTKAVHHPRLADLFSHYYQIIVNHVNQLEEVFKELEESPEGKKCQTIEALIDADKSLIHKDADESVKDAALIGAVQRMQHYKIAAFGCACAYARLLSDGEAASVLNKAIEDEKRYDRLFSRAAADINREARNKTAIRRDKQSGRIRTWPQPPGALT